MTRLVSSWFPHHGYSIDVGPCEGKQTIFSVSRKVFSCSERAYAVLQYRELFLKGFEVICGT